MLNSRKKHSLVLALIISLCVSCGNDDSNDDQLASPQYLFQPFSSTTENILPFSSGLPFAGESNSPGAAIEIDGTYYLFYNDLVGLWPSNDIRIGYAYSTDLVNWERNDEITLSGEHVPYLNGTNEHPFVSSVIVEDDNSLVLYFDVFQQGNAIGIGRATAPSIDGPWSVNDEMVLVPETSGWDARGITSAQVVKLDNEYRLYYSVFMDTRTNPEMGIGMATSSDGINWTKHDGPVFTKGPEGSWDSYKVEVPKIIKTSQGWVMAYRSDSGDRSWARGSGFGIATSTDGITWNRIQSEAAVTASQLSEWESMWGSAFLNTADSYYLFIETVAPGRSGTRINIVSFTGDLFE